MSNNMWEDVTKKNPCANCGKATWCSRTRDGGAEICKRIPGYGFYEKKDKHGATYWVRRTGGRK